MAFSEDTKERIVKAVDVSKTLLHYGWVPFVLYIGFTRSTPQPSLINCSMSRLSNHARSGSGSNPRRQAANIASDQTRRQAYAPTAFPASFGAAPRSAGLSTSVPGINGRHNSILPTSVNAGQFDFGHPGQHRVTVPIPSSSFTDRDQTHETQASRPSSQRSSNGFELLPQPASDAARRLLGSRDHERPRSGDLVFLPNRPNTMADRVAVPASPDMRPKPRTAPSASTHDTTASHMRAFLTRAEQHQANIETTVERILQNHESVLQGQSRLSEHVSTVLDAAQKVATKEIRDSITEQRQQMMADTKELIEDALQDSISPLRAQIESVKNAAERTEKAVRSVERAITTKINELNISFEGLNSSVREEVEMIREGNEELASTEGKLHRHHFEELRRLILEQRTRKAPDDNASRRRVPRATSPMEVDLAPPHQTVPSVDVDIVPHRSQLRLPITTRPDSASPLSLGRSSHSGELDARRKQGDDAPVAEDRVKTGSASARTARAVPQLDQPVDDLPALPAEEEVPPVPEHRSKKGSAKAVQAVPRRAQSPDDLLALSAEEEAGPVAERRATHRSAKTAQAVPQRERSPDDLPALPAEEGSVDEDAEDYDRLPAANAPAPAKKASRASGKRAANNYASKNRKKAAESPADAGPSTSTSVAAQRQSSDGQAGDDSDDDRPLEVSTTSGRRGRPPKKASKRTRSESNGSEYVAPAQKRPKRAAAGAKGDDTATRAHRYPTRSRGGQTSLLSGLK